MGKSRDEIIKDYGLLLQKVSGRLYGAPASMLPYTKDEIKQAIGDALSHLGGRGDDAERIALEYGYVFLAKFIPDDLAEAGMKAQELFLSENTNNPDWKYVDMLPDIDARISAEEKKLKAELKGLKK